MKKKWIFVVAPPAAILFVALCGEVVMRLWNWLLPSIFGWRPITFWQGLGLLVLCRILFGGLGSHGNDNSKSRGPGAQKWERLTPEEREKFRLSMRSPCGDGAQSAGETGSPA